MKRCAKIILAAVLLFFGAAAGIAGTLAYLQTVTPIRVNAFASDKKISFALRERAWDGYGFEDAQTSNGQGIKPGLSDEDAARLGYTQASAYVPGQQIDKDPTVKNTGSAAQGVTVYAAIKVQYFDDEERLISYEQFRDSFLSSGGIAFNSDWTKISGEDTAQIYMYDAPLKPGEESTSLFTQVPVSEDLTAGADGKLPSFSVCVTAYAVQADNMAEDTVGIYETMYQFATSKNS